MRTRSPIEMMIDRACGFDPDAPRDMITLRCPECGKTKDVERDRGDPPGTAVIVFSCNECDVDPKRDVQWFNAVGQQIDCYGRLMEPPT